MITRKIKSPIARKPVAPVPELIAGEEDVGDLASVLRQERAVAAALSSTMPPVVTIPTVYEQIASEKATGSIYRYHRILGTLLQDTTASTLRSAIIQLSSENYNLLSSVMLGIIDSRKETRDLPEFVVGDVVRATPLGRGSPLVGVVIGGGKHLRMWPVRTAAGNIVKCDWQGVEKLSEPRCAVEKNRVNYEDRWRIDSHFYADGTPIQRTSDDGAIGV